MYFVKARGPALVTLGECFFAMVSLAKTFQNLSVSSAPALTTLSPSALTATWRIRSSWPLNFAKVDNLEVAWSHDHTTSWLDGLPCVERSSLWYFDHTSPLTCESVSQVSCSLPLQAFHRQIRLSVEPPPLARTLGCHGDHANACGDRKWPC